MEKEEGLFKKCFCHICRKPFQDKKLLKMHQNKCLQFGAFNKCAHPEDSSRTVCSVEEYFYDPKRKEPLIGVQNAVKYNITDSNNHIVRCPVCDVEAELIHMLKHFIGSEHRKTYMSLNFKHLLPKISDKNNEDTCNLLRETAKHIESLEAIKDLEIICVSKTSGPKLPVPDASTKQKEVNLNYNYCADNRQLASNYLQSLKISSTEEASTYVDLMQSLSEALKEYCRTSNTKISVTIPEHQNPVKSERQEKDIISTDYESRAKKERSNDPEQDQATYISSSYVPCKSRHLESNYLERNSNKSRHRNGSPSESWHSVGSPSESWHSDGSPSESRHREKSRSEPRHSEESPSEPRHREESPSEPRHCEESPSEPSHLEESPSEPSHREESPSEPSHREESPSEPSHRKESPSEPRHLEESPSEPRHREESPAEFRHRKRRPAEFRQREKSPSESTQSEKSPSESRHREKSPSESSHRKRRRSESSHRGKSPSESRYRGKSPSESRHRGKSPSESRHRGKSPSESRHRGKSPYEPSRRESTAEHNKYTGYKSKEKRPHLEYEKSRNSQSRSRNRERALFTSSTSSTSSSDDSSTSSSNDSSSSDDSTSRETSKEKQIVQSKKSIARYEKVLTPEILQVLKGKDVEAATEILKSLAFYFPALQGVNLEQMAEVLFQSGALD